MKTIRYQVRDLGAGLLEPGGLSHDGAVAFTALIDELSTFAITSIATVAYPYAPAMRLPSEAKDRSAGSSADGWDFFRSHAAAINRDGAVAGWAVTAAPLGSSVTTEALRVDAGRVGRRLPPVAGFTSSVARAVGFDGTIVGDSANAETSVATAWRGTEATRLDGGLPDATFSRAVAINARGTVLGFFQTRSGAVRGWLRDANGGVEPDVGPTGIDAFPSDLNDSGRVVGVAADQRGWFAHRSGTRDAPRPLARNGRQRRSRRQQRWARSWVTATRRRVSGRCPERGAAAPARVQLTFVPRISTPSVQYPTAAACTVPSVSATEVSFSAREAAIEASTASTCYLPTRRSVPGLRRSPDEILFGLQPRAGIFGVQLSSDGHRARPLAAEQGLPARDRARMPSVPLLRGDAIRIGLGDLPGRHPRWCSRDGLGRGRGSRRARPRAAAR